MILTDEAREALRRAARAVLDTRRRNWATASEEEIEMLARMVPVLLEEDERLRADTIPRAEVKRVLEKCDREQEADDPYTFSGAAVALERLGLVEESERDGG